MKERMMKRATIKFFTQQMKEQKKQKIPIKNRLTYKKISELVGMSIKTIRKWENRTNLNDLKRRKGILTKKMKSFIFKMAANKRTDNNGKASIRKITGKFNVKFKKELKKLNKFSVSKDIIWRELKKKFEKPLKLKK